MQLKIYSPQETDFVQCISWNNEEIKAEVAEKVQHYKSLVYTDTEIKTAKADKATLNKFVTALEDKRKEIKKQCLAPYEQFERQIKEIVAIVNEPIRLIDTQIKDYEEKKKAEKLEEIKTYFEQCDKPFDFPLEKIYNPKWLNMSVSIKTVCAEIDSILQMISLNLATLSNLPDFAFESIEIYKDTLDINKVIAEGKRLADISKRKEEYQKQFDVVEQPTKQQQPTAPKTDSNAQWIGFKAYLTVEQATALNKFFKENNIDFAPLPIF